MMIIEERKPKIEKIEDIRKRFRRRWEWLMIEVKKMDPNTSEILTGRLLAHGPNRDEILRASMLHKSHIFIDCSRHDLPKGCAYVL